MKNKEKKLFPLFVDLTGKKAVVVGAGKIATRRVKPCFLFWEKFRSLPQRLPGKFWNWQSREK